MAKSFIEEAAERAVAKAARDKRHAEQMKRAQSSEGEAAKVLARSPGKSAPSGSVSEKKAAPGSLRGQSKADLKRQLGMK